MAQSLRLVSGEKDPVKITAVINQLAQKVDRVPWLDVRAFGAIGDGNTDDTNAIQAAITAASSGGTIYFPNGVYAITTAGGLTVSTTGLHLLGESGQGGVLLRTTNQDITILTINADSVTVDNLSFNGGGVNCSKSVIVINSIGVRSFLYRCIISGGFYAVDNSAPYTFMTFCRIGTTYGDAVLRIKGSSAGMYGYGNQIDTNWPVSTPSAGSISSISARAGTTGYTVGNLVTFSGYILQCRISGTSGSTSPILQNYNTDITDGTVKWQLVAPSTYYAILLDTGAVNNVFNLCDMTGPYTASVYITKSAAGNVPDTIELFQCTIGEYINYGVQADFGTALVIRDCQIQGGINSGGIGVYLTSNWGDCSIISGSQITSTITGVFIQGGKNAKVADNWVFGQTNGIQVAANITDFTITGNMCGSSVFGSNTNAIVVSAGTSDYYIITNNNVHGAGTGVTDGGTGTHKTVSGNVG